jgi:hypothetical protein
MFCEVGLLKGARVGDEESRPTDSGHLEWKGINQEAGAGLSNGNRDRTWEQRYEMTQLR